MSAPPTGTYGRDLGKTEGRGGMNYWVSVIFRAIPLAMAAVCVGFGVYVWNSGDAQAAYVAGRVVTFLGAICLCLFCTAATIIRQLIGRFNAVDRVLYPALGCLTAVVAAAYGIHVFNGASGSGQDPQYVAGHVIFGLGLICGCVSTVAAASTKFSLIPANSGKPAGDRTPRRGAFSRGAVVALAALPVLLAAIAWTVAITNLLLTTSPSRFTVGHVVSGIAMVCTSLIGLVWTILRQIQNSYGSRDRVCWPVLVIAMGTASMSWGIVLLILDNEPYYRTPGFVMIGLGLVCFSILSKVGLLALVWRRSFELADRVPLIPIVTALGCLFLAAFVFQAAFSDSFVFIAAHVLVGLGAVCFTLYSIVSILESGTSSEGGDPSDGIAVGTGNRVDPAGRP